MADGVEAAATTAGDLPDTEHSGEPLDHSLTPAAARHEADRLTAELLPVHPLGELFPLIEGDEFKELVASIKAHGLRDPITVQDGMVLDGRNRQRACQAAGVRLRLSAIAGRTRSAHFCDRQKPEPDGT